VATFQVSAPLGDLVFLHAGRTLTISGNRDAVRDWRYQNERVLHGAFGHVFREKDCSLSDVYSMLLDVYGPQRVELTREVVAEVRRELRSIPKGAIP